MKFMARENDNQPEMSHLPKLCKISMSHINSTEQSSYNFVSGRKTGFSNIVSVKRDCRLSKSKFASWNLSYIIIRFRTGF